MTAERWTVGTTPDDKYGVYLDGELLFVAVDAGEEAIPARDRAELLVVILNAAGHAMREIGA